MPYGHWDQVNCTRLNVAGLAGIATSQMCHWLTFEITLLTLGETVRKSPPQNSAIQLKE